jgi:large subunit ribosomal protein L10
LATYERTGTGTPLKRQKVADLAAKLERSKMTVVTDYRGMDVPEISDLRSQLRQVDTEYHVTKNTLARLAVAQSGMEALDEAITGTTAVALSFGEVTAPAKILTDFARASRFLKIRAALLQGQVLSADQLLTVANLPGRPMLQAQFLGALQSPAANLLGTLNGPMQGLLGVLRARSEQLAAS